MEDFKKIDSRPRYSAPKYDVLSPAGNADVTYYYYTYTYYYVS